MSSKIKSENKKSSLFKKLFTLIVFSMSTLVSVYFINNNEKLDNEETKESMKNEQDIYIANLINDAEYLKSGYYIDEAIDLLNSSEYKDDEQIKSEVAEFENYKSGFVKYEGDIEHIFFHSLIVYPQLAFDNNGHPPEGYNMWFTTVEEVKRMLPLLKEKGYVLVNMSDIFTQDNNGQVIKKDLYLPKGKKPLVISQDDVNYYNYMELDGFAEKLVLTENKKVETLVKNLDNEFEVTNDGDLVPILEEFLIYNPEFSYRGAKGILAVTGYEGVFGYNLENNESIEEAKKIANKLKENGWEIASHSYTHNGNGFFGQNPLYKNLKYDFDKWNEKIRNVVGDTDIFIAPYGTTLDGANFNLAKSSGFNIYCNVYRKSSITTKNNTLLMSRFNIDGFTMIKHTDEVNERFFDVEKVIDKNRPPL